MLHEPESHRVYRFGEFLLDLDRGELSRDGDELKLRPKAFDVLTYLVEHHGRLVSRRELTHAVWGHAYITGGSLTQCLFDIRQVLGDGSHEMIRTVPRRGFIFELPVDSPESAPAHADAAEGPPPPENRSPETSLKPRDSRSGLLWTLLAGGLAAAIYLGGELFTASRHVDAAPNTIAVLPFEDLSPGGDQEYFADGISEELINGLTRIPGLQVTARTSAFSFKGTRTDIKTIADRLGVAHVLEGSVRKAGNRLRITAQLVAAESDSHLWSETFDRELGDIFEIQSEIAGAVASSLHVALSDSEIRAIAPPRDPVAYEHYLQGGYFWHRRADGDLERAEAHYRKAVGLDPGYASAWAGLAGAYVVLSVQGAIDPDDGMAKAQQAVEQALATGPDLAEAHLRAASYYYFTGNERMMEHHWEKAKELGGDSWLVISRRSGKAFNGGEYERAIELMRRAVDLDPLSAITRGGMGSMLMAAGRYVEAEREFIMAIDLNPELTDRYEETHASIELLQGRTEEAVARAEQWPNKPVRDRLLTIGYGALGMKEEAGAAIERLRARPGAESVFRLAEVAAHSGDIEAAISYLESIPLHMTESESKRVIPTWRDLLRESPYLIPLRDDPRWEPLIESLPHLPRFPAPKSANDGFPVRASSDLPPGDG